jgi:hypothetical protein
LISSHLVFRGFLHVVLTLSFISTEHPAAKQGNGRGGKVAGVNACECRYEESEEGLQRAEGTPEQEGEVLAEEERGSADENYVLDENEEEVSGE